MEEDRRRRSENEEDEWEYEEDIGDDKERIPKQGERYVKYSITADNSLSHPPAPLYYPCVPFARLTLPCYIVPFRKKYSLEKGYMQ